MKQEIISPKKWGTLKTHGTPLHVLRMPPWPWKPWMPPFGPPLHATARNPCFIALVRPKLFQNSVKQVKIAATRALDGTISKELLVSTASWASMAMCTGPKKKIHNHYLCFVSC